MESCSQLRFDELEIGMFLTVKSGPPALSKYGQSLVDYSFQGDVLKVVAVAFPYMCLDVYTPSFYHLNMPKQRIRLDTRLYSFFVLPQAYVAAMMAYLDDFELLQIEQDKLKKIEKDLRASLDNFTGEEL